MSSSCTFPSTPPGHTEPVSPDLDFLRASPVPAPLPADHRESPRGVLDSTPHFYRHESYSGQKSLVAVCLVRASPGFLALQSHIIQCYMWSGHYLALKASNYFPKDVKLLLSDPRADAAIRGCQKLELLFSFSPCNVGGRKVMLCFLKRFSCLVWNPSNQSSF